MSTNGGDGAGAPRVVVLGGGPAGDVASLRAAQLGADSTLIERAELGGTCLNWGCIPTKSLLATADVLRRIRRADEYGLVVPEVSFDFPKMMERKDEIVLRMRQGVEGAAKRKGVKVVRGEGRVDGDAVVVEGERHPFDHLVVCVGTEPAGLPGFDMEHPAILTSNDILVLDEVPESMLVVGGGVVGCEFASLFAPLGTRITVVEILPRRRYEYRAAPLPPELRRVALDAATTAYEPELLAASIGDLLRTPPKPDLSHIRPTVSLDRRLRVLRELLAGQGSIDFDRSFGDEDKLTQAVTLFALLELHKRGEATWEQGEVFGAIEVKTAGTSSASRPGVPGEARA